MTHIVVDFIKSCNLSLLIFVIPILYNLVLTNVLPVAKIHTRGYFFFKSINC
jgi:hypothetical protein